jgi:hypothetical protein
MPRGEYEKGPSPQERTQDALKTLERGIDAILSSDTFADYLRTMARFHHYSAGNIILIRYQKPEATQVAGYQRWKELGRQVKKGERGIKILVPYIRRRNEEESEGREESRVLSGFGVGTVFDVSQTEGPPLPEPPTVVFVEGASDPGMRLYVDLMDLLEEQGVTVDREDTVPANGYFIPHQRHVGIGHHIDGDQVTKTLAHETTHVFAGHTLGMDAPDVETVAESAAFVILNYYGLDSSDYSFPYVARWAEDRAVLKRNLEGIQAVSHAIISCLEGGSAAPRHKLVIT